MSLVTTSVWGGDWVGPIFRPPHFDWRKAQGAVDEKKKIWYFLFTLLGCSLSFPGLFADVSQRTGLFCLKMVVFCLLFERFFDNIFYGEFTIKIYQINQKCQAFSKFTTFFFIDIFPILQISKAYKMKFGEKIKLLRKEKGLSQEDLGKKIGGDAKQISLYENGKMSPSADGIKKLALALDISTDYLLFEEADKKPLTLEKDEFVQRINEIQKFSIQDKDALITIIDGLIVKNKFQALAK